MYLFGSGVAALITGPFSETFGRNPVYIGTMIFLMIFIMASGLSPNIGAQLTFRFFVGFFAAAPLTVAGGTIADLWNSMEKVYAFPLFAIPAFGGALMGPAIGSYVYTFSTWRWTEWISLIFAGLMTSLAFLFLPETHASTILLWRAKHLRAFSGDNRYQSASEIVSVTLLHRMRIALTRPWLLALEPIVVVITLYLTIVWAIIFTFLDGYSYIFMEPYKISQGLSNVIFVAEYVGVMLASFLVPVVYIWTKNDVKKRNNEKGGHMSGPVTVRPETRLWYAMLGGAWAVPVSLFWLGWTNYVRTLLSVPILQH
jgi:MFS family permease